MAHEIVEAMKKELTLHGATDFRIETATKHDWFIWTWKGKEMRHVVSKSGKDINQRCMLTIKDVRRMIGVNEGSGPGDRRVKQVHPRQKESIIIAAPEITIRPDPMEALVPLKEQMEKQMEATTEVVSAHHTRATKKVKESFVMPNPTIREREWLEEMLSRGDKERHIVPKRKVTPGLAAAMLELNSVNRPLVEQQIKLHEGRLQRGDFILSHQGISFSKTRVLNDGQHRLMAIARSGITGDLQITFGAEREEFAIIDAGRFRRASDVIGVTIKDNPVFRAAIARMIAVGETHDNRIDQQRVAVKALEMKELVTTDIGMRLGWSMARVCHPTPPAAAYCWIAERSPNKLRVNEFFDGLPSGEGLTGIRLKLREWLRHKTIHRIKAPGGEGFWRVGGIVLAWNAWIDGRKNVILDWRSVTELPEPK